MIFSTNLLGMAIGPTVAGMLSDQFDLRTALLMVSFSPLLACACYAGASLLYGRSGADARADDETLSVA